MLRPGRNAIGAQVAPGWYAGRIATAGRYRYGPRPALLAQLEITDASGSTTVVVSDGQWRSTVGGLLAADLLDGEEYDARHEPSGWSQPHLDVAGWRPVLTITAHPALLVA
jgi:alpha-L-rhamnosidase